MYYNTHHTADCLVVGAAKVVLPHGRRDGEEAGGSHVAPAVVALHLDLRVERVMTRCDSTRRVRVESSRVNKFWLIPKNYSTFSSTFFHQANFNWNQARMLILNALVTDKSKFSPLSSVLALTRESRVRAPARLEWLEWLKSWLARPIPTSTLGREGWSLKKRKKSWSKKKKFEYLGVGMPEQKCINVTG